MSLDAAVTARRSVRAFGEGPITDAELGQLLWSMQGLTDAARGLRAVPSAGALYPLELHVAREDGLYRYDPAKHALLRTGGDARAGLAKAALGQEVVRSAKVIVVITAVIARTRTKYGDRAERFVALEAGHAMQNALLEIAALGLAATPVGAFDDDALRTALGAGSDETPLYVLPVGRPAQ